MQRKTRLDTQTTQTPQLSGVDTSGVKKTNDVLATQKTTKLGSQPVAGLDGKTKTIADIVTPQPATMLEKQAQSNPQNAWNSANTNYQAPQAPTTTAEKTTVTTPEGTTTTTKEAPISNQITKDTNWQDVQNKDMNSLEQLVEQRYGTIATQKDGKLTANIGGKEYQWSLDQNGNPQKTEVTNPVTQSVLSRYMSASSDELYNGFITGNIPPDLEGQLTQNPNFAIAKEKYRKKMSVDQTNKNAESIFNTATGKTIEIPTPSIAENVVKNQQAKGKTVDEILNYTQYLDQDTELTGMVQELNGKTAQYNELKNLTENNTRRLIKENPGILNSSAMLLAARQNEPVYQQMEALSWDMQNMQANINYREKIKEKEYDQIIQVQQEQRAMANALELQKQQQLLQTGDINSTDPFLQQKGIENAVNQLYAQYPIPGMESPTLKIEKVKSMIAQGMTPQQAIQQLEQEIRNSDRYKNYINAYNSSLQPTQTQDWQKLSDNSLYNQKTGEVKSVGGEISNVTVQTDPQSIADFSINKRGRTNLQCGELVNDYIYKITGTDPQGDARAEDTLEDKNKALATLGLSNTPIVGGLFTLDVGNEVGHIGIVQSVDGNTITVLEANRAGKTEGEPPTIATYTISDKMKFSQAPSSAYSNEQQIYDAIFQGSGGASKVSEAESKTMKDRAKLFASQGLTPQEALMKYKGLNVTGSNADVAGEYINIGDNLTKKPSNYEMTVAKYLNNGDTTGLNNYINNLVDAQVSSIYKSDAILSSDYNTGVRRADELISLINNNRGKIGAFDGRVNDLIQKFANTPDYQKIKTLLQMSQADMRKYFAGSAVTETEMKALQDFIGGTTKMNSDNLITMLTTLTNDRKGVYLSQRPGMIPPGQEQTQGQVLYKDPNDGIEYTKESLIKEIETQITNGTATEQEVLNWLEKNNLSYILD